MNLNPKTHPLKTEGGAPTSGGCGNQGESGRRLRTGRVSGLMAAGALLVGPLEVPVGTEAAIDPSEYAFFRKDSATSCALPVSSLVCLALLYSLTARSRWPSRSKILPR